MNAARARWTAYSAVVFLAAGLISAALTSAASPAAAAAPDPGTYQALTPARILDTRTGNGAPTAPVAAAATLDVTVLGQGGIPASGVSAVVFNLTDTGPTTYGFITAYPAGQPLPLASSINFSAGETRAHQVVVAPGTNGQVALYNGSAAPVDLVADVVGYYTAGTPTDGGEFAPLTPARILDTRTGNGAAQRPLDGPGDDLTFQALGRGGVPASGVSSVVINLTATRPSTYGFLTAAPGVNTSSSSVNFQGGRSVSNLVITPVSADGTISVTASLSGHVDVVADVTGYFVDGAPSAPGRTGPVAPARLLDTRRTHAPIPAQGSIDVAVAGQTRVPTGASAALLNITAAGTTTGGFLAVYPSDVARPTSSTVNFDHNTVANLTISRLGSVGRVRIYNGSSAPVDVVIDIAGFVGPVPGGLTWSGSRPVPGGDNSIWFASCATPTFCMANDPYDVWRWDGHSWSSPTHFNDFFGSLTCPVASFCAAIVGLDIDFFNGSTWTSSGWPGAALDRVGALSCASATFCVATSNGPRNGHMQSWVFDAGTWTNYDTGVPQSDGFLSISCAAPKFCLANNSFGTTVRFDGTAWTKTSATPLTFIEDISCVSATFCMVVSETDATVYNGTSWSAQTPLDIDPGLTDIIRRVSCATTTFCMAGTAGGFELVYDGSAWSTPFDVDPGGDLHNVACGRPTFCVVVAGNRSFFGA